MKMAGNGLDIQKLLAIQAQLKQKAKPLTNVKKVFIDVGYIKRDGSKDLRTIILYIPIGNRGKIPLVYVPHYEMREDSSELSDYLKQGWAVSSCYGFKNEYNRDLAFDDLVFNNAALYTLRNNGAIDENRIAVVGGSAGGYSCMMLTALQLGICASVANGPPCNLHFNFLRYFNEANKFNLQAISSMSGKDRKDVIKLLSSLPLPFVGAICSGAGFEKMLRYIKNKDDMREWEAISPTAFAECFCNPVFLNHTTSDILVPLDQITHEFVYDKPGKTMPEGFNYRMEKVEGKLNYTLCERLNKKQLNLFSVPPVDGEEVKPYSFKKDKMFNVCVCDEGAPEAFASHNLGTHTGRYSDVNYLQYMFSQTAAKTNILTEEKLALFAERYEGKAPQLISHDGIDDTLYGSLAVYRAEIISELKKWAGDNGKKAFMRVSESACRSYPEYAFTIGKIAETI